MNLEMAVTDEMLAIAEELQPTHVCLVPERREELTTEGGLDVAYWRSQIEQACQRMTDAGVITSLFIDPDPEQIRAAAWCGAPVIELHTGRYADAASAAVSQIELERIRACVELGSELGLVVNAGHGLNYQNVEPVAAIPDIYELNIGHAIIARALSVGIRDAVREMRKLTWWERLTRSAINAV